MARLALLERFGLTFEQQDAMDSIDHARLLGILAGEAKYQKEHPKSSRGGGMSARDARALENM